MLGPVLPWSLGRYLGLALRLGISEPQVALLCGILGCFLHLSDVRSLRDHGECADTYT